MSELKYTVADFKSDQEVKWCPGCGDYAVLSAIQKAMPQIAANADVEHSRFAVVSGIGCSSRFPYYVSTYGFHGIHGRANAIATGLKTANPDLSVFVMTGDGDSLAIGGNHFIHSIRRNIDLNVVLFNNEIYGLTKGQYSPTTKLGTKTKTSPYGTIETPFNPGELVIGAQGRFFARTLDMNINLSAEVIEAGVRHKGTAVVEILQNCVIFADGVHSAITDKEMKEERQLILRHGEPMVFGKNKDKGIMFDMKAGKLKVVEIGKDGITLDDIMVHDAHSENPSMHWMLVHMKAPEYPVALGVIRDVEGTTYNDALDAQIENVKAKSSIHCVEDLLNSGDVWEVK